METIIRHEGLSIAILGYTGEKRLSRWKIPHVTALSTVDLDSGVSGDMLRGDRQERNPARRGAY